MSTVVMRLTGGEQVVAAITRDSAENLEIEVGDAVAAVVKSTEVMVAKERSGHSPVGSAWDRLPTSSARGSLRRSSTISRQCA